MKGTTHLFPKTGTHRWADCYSFEGKESVEWALGQRGGCRSEGWGREDREIVGVVGRGEGTEKGGKGRGGMTRGRRRKEMKEENERRLEVFGYVRGR